jgi:ribosomal protein S21
MAINAMVEKNKNESSTNLLRRFSRKARAVGFLRAVRGKRFYQREDSDLRKKQSAIARIEGAKRYEKMKKLGKIS